MYTSAEGDLKLDQEMSHAEADLIIQLEHMLKHSSWMTA